MRLGGLSYQQDRGAAGANTAERTAGVAERAARAAADLLSMRRRVDRQARRRASRRLMSIVGVGLSPRGDEDRLECTGPRVLRTEGLGQRLEEKNSLRQSQEVLRVV